METEGYRVTQTGNLKEATEQFSAMIKSEIALYLKVIKSANIRIE